jgi:hypothetical protein
MEVLTRENIQTFAHIILATTFFLNFRAFNLHKKALEANVFNELINKIISHMYQKPKKIILGDEESDRWFSVAVGILEIGCFYANYGYLNSEMIEHFKPKVIGMGNDIKTLNLEHRRRLLREGSSEFVKFFKKATGEDIFA